MEQKFKHLYTMSYIDPTDNNEYVFYVGKAVKQDWKARAADHKRKSKNGTEDKYEFIRQLESANIEWMVKVFKSVPIGVYHDDWERWWVIDFVRNGHPIKNMRMGDIDCVEQIEDVKIRSVEDVKQDRVRREEEKKLRAYDKSEKLQKRIEEQAKIDADPTQVLLERVRQRNMVKKALMDKLWKGKWKKGCLKVGILSFERGRLPEGYYVKELNSGVICGPGNKYMECYVDMVSRIGELK